MSSIITLALSLLQALIPSLGTANAALIAQIINGLVALVPILINEYQSLLPIIQNVIAVLKGNGAVTPDQIAALEAMEVQIDAAFEAAATAALAEDAATTTG